MVKNRLFKCIIRKMLTTLLRNMGNIEFIPTLVCNEIALYIKNMVKTQCYKKMGKRYV